MRHRPRGVLVIDPGELIDLEAELDRAVNTGDESRLRVLGYGEVSAVIAWPTDSPVVAAKRSPPFHSSAAADDYTELVGRYLYALDDHGIAPIPTELHRLDREDGAIILYCVQPILDPGAIGPAALADLREDEVAARVKLLVDHVMAFVGPTQGLDAQLSNWVWSGDRWGYLDVTTPMFRDRSGAELLDLDLFLASLPWALRPVVKRFFLADILDKYYRPRGVLLDLLGNLHKEKLAHLVPLLLPLVNRHLSPAITDGEVRAYYRSDARTWAVLQRLRRADRLWQRRVRRRAYPFLLPGRIER